jgi:polyhydroxybutyrate depolymerase
LNARPLIVAIALSIAGCRQSCPAPPPPPKPSASGAEARAGELVLGGARPVRVHAPPSARGPLPLVIALHGYGDRGESFLDYLGYYELARSEGFLVAAPDGTPDSVGSRFWNAGGACCNFDRVRVDDVAYLGGLIREAGARLRGRLDPKRVYLIGLSNGGFMAYRLACEGAPIAAAVVIAGAAPPADARCAPTGAASLLHVHPDADQVVLYAGGRNLLGRGGEAYPGAVASVRRWARLVGCGADAALAAGGELDLERSIAGAETRALRLPRCPAGVDVELWTVRGGPHVPDFGEAFARASWRWLARHARR